MRRYDREITEFNELIQVMEKCDVCRLAFNDGGYPYILPLNFGMKVEGDKVTLYFHGAAEGKKYEVIAGDNRASFEMDCSHRLVTDGNKGTCTMEYESVIGRGKLEIHPEEEKYDALCLLMSHYHKQGFPFQKEVLPRTTVLKLVVDSLSGKIRMKKHD